DDHREHVVPPEVRVLMADEDAGGDDRQLLRDREPQPGGEQGQEDAEVAVLGKALEHHPGPSGGAGGRCRRVLSTYSKGVRTVRQKDRAGRAGTVRCRWTTRATGPSRHRHLAT